MFNDLTPQDNLIQFAYDQPTFTNIPQFDFNDASSPTPTNEIQVMTLSHGKWAYLGKMVIDFRLILKGC